jgi:hypothetical protein
LLDYDRSGNDSIFQSSMLMKVTEEAGGYLAVIALSAAAS